MMHFSLGSDFKGATSLWKVHSHFFIVPNTSHQNETKTHVPSWKLDPNSFHISTLDYSRNQRCQEIKDPKTLFPRYSNPPDFGGRRGGKRGEELQYKTLWLKASIYLLFPIVKSSFPIIPLYSFTLVLKYKKTVTGQGTKIILLQLINTGQLSVPFIMPS